jgi:hypothetical protein
MHNHKKKKKKKKKKTRKKEQIYDDGTFKCLHIRQRNKPKDISNRKRYNTKERLLHYISFLVD